MVLLQSTFTALLEVTLDERHRLQNVSVLESDRGVYFGLTRAEESVFCVARNTDVNGQIVDPSRPVSTLITVASRATKMLAPSSENTGVDCGGPKAPFAERKATTGWPIPDTRGVHQIRCRDGLIWMMNCRDPELVAFDPKSGIVIGTVSLAPLVPRELQHDFVPEHLLDRYHFNSLFFTDNRLFVLAHNWGFGSFALELDFPSPSQLLKNPRVLRTHTGLGQQAHDIYVESEILSVLDSANARLLVATRGDIQTTQSGQHGFARGLAANSDFFWIGHGSVAKREDRVHGPTHISILDRQSLRPVAQVEVGAFGNPCDLLLVSERDLTD